MSSLEMIMWAILAAHSIMAVACLLMALQVRLFGRGLDVNQPRVERCLADLREISEQANSGTLREPAAQLESIRKRLDLLQKESSLAAIMHYVVAPQRDVVSLELVITRSLSQVEQGARALCSFLSKSAPQAGLAGTLVGVQQALNNFAAADSSAHLNSGVAVALCSTLWGVLCTMLMLFTVRVLWDPYLGRLAARLREQAEITAKLLVPLRSLHHRKSSQQCSSRSHNMPVETVDLIHSQQISPHPASGNGAATPCPTNS